MTKRLKNFLIAGASIVFVSQSFASDGDQAKETPPEEVTACIEAAAPVQFGGLDFAQLVPKTAIPLCEAAIKFSEDPALKAYYARALEKDGRTTRARRFYELAAEAGNTTALVAQLYYQHGQNPGGNTAKILDQLEVLIEQGDDWQARAFNANLHIEMFQKSGVDKTKLMTALEQLSEAADQGSPYGLFLLAWAHENGIGFEKSSTEAEKYYREAVKKGSVPAMAFLGRQLEKQNGHQEEAADLLWRAFKHKNALAIQLLRDEGKNRAPATLSYVRTRLAAEGLFKGAVTGTFDRATKTALMKANGEVIPATQAPLRPRTTRNNQNNRPRSRAQSRKKTSAKPKSASKTSKREGR